MAETLKPDLCIVGAGAAGIELAIAARSHGASVVLIDRGAPEPGDGPQGRLARAAVLASAARAQAIRSAAQVGIDAPEPKPNFRAIAERAETVVDAAMPEQAEERLAALGITCLTGTPAFVDRSGLKLGETLVRARHVVLATGARAVVPDLPGLDQVAYFTPDTIGANIRKLSHLVVIGGDAEAVELAQAYRRLGADVTLVPQGALLPGFDPELVGILSAALRAEGVAIRDDASVTAIQPRSQGTGIALRRADGSDDALDASHILVAIGRDPGLTAGWLDKARLRPDAARPGHVQLDAAGCTSSGRISAIGAAAGERDPGAVARQQQAALDRIAGGRRPRPSPDRVVRTVMTGPALAQIGVLEQGALLRPGAVVLRASLAETHAARAGGTALGTAKLVIGRNGVILGGGMVGQGAGETVAILAMAIEAGLGVAALERLMLPEPSPAALLARMATQYRTQQAGAGGGDLLARLRRLLP